MATIPSAVLLIKDIVGQGVELSGVQDSRITERANRVFYYNFALTELYNILVLINSNEYTTETSSTATVTGDFTKHRTIDLAVSAFNALDKIITIEFADKTETPDVHYDNEELGITDFVRHKISRLGAVDPYDETIVWTIINTKLHLIVGESLTVTIADITADIHFRRQPTLVTLGTWDAGKIDIPDKYMSLMVLRIASLIEYRDKGVSEKSMAAVKSAYEILLSNVQIETRNKIMDSILTPIGVPHDVSGNN